MKTRLLIIICFIMSLEVLSQEADTIFANENYNTTLFFPDKIKQGIVGASNFAFSYNEEQPQHLGLLKALPGTTSNLLVLTQDGRIYSYFLKYREELPQLNYFIVREQSIGNEVPRVAEEVESDSSLDMRAQRDSLARREKYLGKLSLYYLSSSHGKISSTKKDGLRLTVEKAIHYRSEVFLVINIENKSGIAFEPDYVKVYTRKGNQKRNSSFQKVLKEPIFRYNFPNEILQEEKKRFVLVFGKFTLGEKEKIQLEVREKSGNRFLRLLFSN